MKKLALTKLQFIILLMALHSAPHVFKPATLRLDKMKNLSLKKLTFQIAISLTIYQYSTSLKGQALFIYIIVCLSILLLWILIHDH